MNWIISIHIIGFVSWFAGLFYLPRLYVYHAMTNEKVVSEQFKVMERKLYLYIMNPAMIVTIISGLLLMGDYLSTHTSNNGWLYTKLILVFFLILYHIVCGYFLAIFKANLNKLPHKFFRYFNEVPTVILILIAILAEVQPF